jgi:hypothetical protein
MYSEPPQLSLQVQRLNTENAAKSSRYFWQVTRLIEQMP